MLLTAVQESWLADIADAEQIEQKMWKAYEDRFSAAHEESLAWRYRPDTREERVIVEKYFPSQKRVTKKSDATLVITGADGTRREVKVTLRIDTAIEVDYYKHGGILPFVLRQLLAA